MKESVDKVSSKTALGETISQALVRLRKDAPKEGVSLLDITRKISSKKFGKGKK